MADNEEFLKQAEVAVFLSGLNMIGPFLVSQTIDEKYVCMQTAIPVRCIAVATTEAASSDFLKIMSIYPKK